MATAFEDWLYAPELNPTAIAFDPWFVHPAL
jgi:hypothetical protein